MSHPRILTIDIETSPALSFHWRTFKESISPDQVVIPPRMICFAAKWHDEPDVLFASEYHNGRRAMIQYAWNLLDEADWVVHYNGNAFDIPHLQREFLVGKPRLGIPSPYKQVDLMKTARREFRFLSSRLQQVITELGLVGKLHTDFLLWRRIVLDNEPAAWEEMKAYNIQDVVAEEQVYDEFLPWIERHPNWNLYLDHDGEHPLCPNCGSGNVQRRGFQKTDVAKYRRYHCQQCGKWSRGRRAVVIEDLRTTPQH